MPDCDPCYLFAYGIFKKECEGYELLENAEFLSEAITQHRHALYEVRPSDEYSFPVLVLNEDEYFIKGELYSLTNDTLKKLDAYMGVQIGDYTRVKITVKKLASGDIVSAYVYTMDIKLLFNLIIENKAKLITTIDSDVLSWECD